MSIYAEQAEHRAAPSFGHPPRQVVIKTLTPFVGGYFAVAVLILLTFYYAVPAVLWPFVEAYGTTTTAKVVSTDENWLTKKQRYFYRVDVTFDVAGQAYEHWLACDQDQYNLFTGSPATPVQIRYLTSNPGWSFHLAPPSNAEIANLHDEAMASVLLVVMDVALFCKMILLPIQQRRLVESGDYVTGSIENRRMFYGKQTLYFLYYSYEPELRPFAAYEGICKGKIQVSKKVYEKFEIGQSITVFYDAERPKFSYAYEPGHYKIIA